MERKIINEYYKEYLNQISKANIQKYNDEKKRKELCSSEHIAKKQPI